MIATKLLAMLLTHYGMQTNTWTVFIDLELVHLFLTKDISEFGKTITSALKELVDDGVRCRSVQMETKQVMFPCARIQNALSADFKSHTLIADCPSELWIELNINTLELPYSGPQCVDGYVAFYNLIGLPCIVTYCGTRAHEVLFSKLLVVEHHVIGVLIPFQMNLYYQYIHKKDFITNQHWPTAEYTPDPGSCVSHPQHRKASNHHANLPLEIYSFTL